MENKFEALNTTQAMELAKRFNDNKFVDYKDLKELDSFVYKVDGLDHINATQILLCKCYGNRFMAIFMGIDGCEINECQGVVMPMTQEYIDTVWVYAGGDYPAPFEPETVKLYEMVDLATAMWKYGFEQETGTLLKEFDVLFKKEV